MAGFDTKLRMSRIVSITFVVALPLMVRGVEQLVGHAQPPIAISIQLAVLLALTALIGGFWARIRLLRPSIKELRLKTQDNSTARWQVGQLASTVAASSLVILGMLLRLGGTHIRTVIVFYGLGYALLLLWFPRRP